MQQLWSRCHSLFHCLAAASSTVLSMYNILLSFAFEQTVGCCTRKDQLNLVNNIPVTWKTTAIDLFQYLSPNNPYIQKYSYSTKQIKHTNIRNVYTYKLPLNEIWLKMNIRAWWIYSANVWNALQVLWFWFANWFSQRREDWIGRGGGCKASSPIGAVRGYKGSSQEK